MSKRKTGDAVADALAAIEADKKHRAKSCKVEIDAVLAKWRCRLVSAVVDEPMQVAPGVWAAQQAPAIEALSRELKADK